jgi:hypothetical protein
MSHKLYRGPHTLHGFLDSFGHLKVIEAVPDPLRPQWL